MLSAVFNGNRISVKPAVKEGCMVKRLIAAVAACLLSSAVLSPVLAGNPVIPGYFADPHVLMDSGKFYIYATTVSDPQGTYDQMVVWKSPDFVHWTMVKVNWPTFVVWAPDAIKGLDGRYYLYPTNAGGYTVWVGVGNSPTGPFANARIDNTPVIPTGGLYGDYCIDGQPFIDTDNQAYMYWGWGASRGIRLNADMATVNGAVQWLQGTKWIANGGTLPQWLKVDFGQNYTVTRCETSPEFHDRRYQYRIEYSVDNTNWFTFADRTANQTIGNPCYVDNGNATARYMRITITTAGNGDWASICEFRVFSNTTLVSQGKTATASSSLTANPPSFAVDGFDFSLPHYVEAPYMIKRNGIYYFMYSNGRCQDETYHVDYSTATSPFGPFTDGPTNPILSSPPGLSADGPGHNSVLKIDTNYYIIYHQHDVPRTTISGTDGVHRQTAADRLVFNTDNSIAKVVTTTAGVGALGPSANNDTNLAKGKTAVASSTQNTAHGTDKAFDESYLTHWSASSTTYPQWLRVDLGQSIRIDRCESEFEYPTVAYRYRIEHSPDNVTWTLYADRTGNTVAECPSIDSGTVTARYFRITLTGCAKTTDPASLWEFKVMQKRATGTVPEAPHAAAVSPVPLKHTFVVTGDNFTIPAGYSHKVIVADIYTISGKRLAGVLIIKGNTISLRKECGVSGGVYLLRIKTLQ